MAWLGSPRTPRINRAQNSRDLDTNKTPILRVLGSGSYPDKGSAAGGVRTPPPSRSALPVGGAGISVQTAAVSSMRSSGENLWSASKSVVSPAGPPTANREVRGTPASLLRLSCLAAPLLQGGKIRLSQPIIRRGTAESTAGCTSPSDSAQYLRMLVVGDIRARSYATGQQSLGDETTDVGKGDQR